MKNRTLLKVTAFGAAAALSLSIPAFAAGADSAASVAESPAVEAAVASTPAAVESVAEAAEAPKERPYYYAPDYITLGEYVDLTVEVEPVNVTEADVDAEVDSAIAASPDAFENVTEGTVAEGDTVNIDFEGKKDDVAFEGGTAQGYELEIGSGQFIPGFEEGLVGVAVGDTVDLDLTFPEEYGNADLAGQAVVFTVKVNSIKKAKEVNDELISVISGGEAATMDEFRALKKAELEESRKTQNEEDAKTNLLNQAVANCTVSEFPQDLVDYVSEQASAYYQSYASMFGTDLETFMTSFVGKSIEDIAKESIQQEFFIQALAEHEKLMPTGDELAAAYDKLAESIGAENGEALLAMYDEETLNLNIAYDEVVEFLYREANVVEASPESSVESVAEAVAVESVAEAPAAESAAESVAE